MSRSISILGAGLVGSVLSVLLRKKGYEVTIYERRSDLRTATIGAGRSINLAMSTRGWKALELAGLREAIEAIAIPMTGRYLHQQDGTAAFQPYGKNGEAIYSVSRGELNKKLMDLAEENGVKILFNQTCDQVDLQQNIIHLTDQEGKKHTVSCDLLLGADGAFSALRKSMILQDRTDYQQFYINSGYKELCIPPNPEGTFQMEKNALHIWPRHNFMMIGLPNTDGSFTCTLFFPFEGKPSFKSIQSDEEIMSFFGEHFPDAIPLMPTLLEDYKNNPTSSLVTVKMYPWAYEDKACLIGDAAHAIVPFYGQGMNAGFEDCSELYALLDRHGDDWETVLQAFQANRKPNADAVAELALNNFIEMRDKVADPKFLERKKIEKDLGIRYAGRFNSVYEMVSFSHTPYAFAWNAMAAQDWLLTQIMNAGDYFTNIEQASFLKDLDTWIGTYEQKVNG
ncbi:NAD(P)/FAD-dependent oxidoreductase [Taibaiella sp. KBW10]|uniref:FAD-dependent oxidoreductase n=1 Tax=Taibaiella sp. KBW10 TaxID=2153357 RepID=UPI000F58F4FF|nr:NAD(P)/FAD-dependent oxidoreductase [Taibaiella sp. KBW10]